jgi:tyrosinase
MAHQTLAPRRVVDRRPLATWLLVLIALLPWMGCSAERADSEAEGEDAVLEELPAEAMTHAHGLGQSDEESLASLNPEYFSDSSDRRRALRVRKNVRSLSSSERKQYVDAVLKLKKTRSPYDSDLSYYDQFVAWHVALNVCEYGEPLTMQMGHGSPMFLPWHRAFTLLFETALRQVSGKPITVPYWDWITTPDHDKSVVFASDFMGGAGDPMDNFAVKTGPFRKGKWTLNIDPPGTRWAQFATDYLTRYLGELPFPLPTQADLDLAMSTTVYDMPPYDHRTGYGQTFRSTLEGNRGDGPPVVMTCTEDGTMPIPIGGSGLHNGIHAWVGGPFTNGTMVLPTSPNDPVFFLHHSQVDRLWAQWQEVNGVDSYVPVSGVPGNNVDDEIMPFDHSGIRVTPAMLANIAKLGYRYE